MLGWIELTEFFTSPLFSAPMWACMLMCLASSLVGVIAFVQRRSLIGEALSHAAYPGVALVISVLVGGALGSLTHISVLVLLGAFITSIGAYYAIDWMEHRLNLSSDAALSVVVTGFLGLGILITSRLQSTDPIWYRQVQLFLYGQAATMTNLHVWLYGVMAAVVVAMVVMSFLPLMIYSFDREFARSIGMRGRVLNLITVMLFSLAAVIGMRSVGVILMAGMLIAPPLAARQFTSKLSTMFLLSGAFGVVSGLLGMYLSVNASSLLSSHFDGARLSLPTGPMILLVAGGIVMFALLFAPYKGLVSRWVRILRFRGRCLSENLLKALWKAGCEKQFRWSEVRELYPHQIVHLGYVVVSLLLSQKVVIKQGRVGLSALGEIEARRLVRLHRLWEAYLHYKLDVPSSEIHKHAEEIEHIITPEIEAEIHKLLDGKTTCPHERPIPAGEVGV
ncbi:MAG: Manganese transport system membrane protein MntC [Chlamydiia bacterium]|nr:Manganese transport system membrane protein MntC [Chlamydiia bacterium]